MSVKEMAMQMSGNTILCSQGPYQRWGRLWHTYSHS
jgi:hypothetical protein